MLAVGLGHAVACNASQDTGSRAESNGPPSRAQRELELPTNAQLEGASQRQLRERLGELEAAAFEHEASDKGVRLARAAAAVAMALARRFDSVDAVTRARAQLRLAARRKRLAGACDAELELAQLEHALGDDPEAAYLAAYRATKRFVGQARDAPCVDRARQRLQALRAHRPAPALLYAVDADPDLDDPSALEAPSPDTAPGDPDVASWAQQHRVVPQAQARLTKLDVYGAGQRGSARSEVRVVLQFDGVVIYRRGEQPAAGGVPRRLFVDLDDARIAPGVAALTPVEAAGLLRVRTLALEDTRVRVSFDVEAATEHRLFFLTDPYRVVMDFRSARRSDPGSGVRTIVLDPGHGGRNPGAKGPTGLRESAVALSLARRVRAALRRQLPDVRVVLTRDGDYEVSLEERAAIANAEDADLFLSIHLNASSNPDDKGGVSTFVLDTSDDEQALRLAARENGTRQQEVTQLQQILADLYREDQAKHSLRLAHELQRETLRGGRRVLPKLPDRGVKRAVFYVLVGARMPAALLEASFITRPEECHALQTDDYRQALADGIATALVRYSRRVGRGESDI